MEGATLSRADLRRSFNVDEWGGGGGNTREARLRRSGHMLGSRMLWYKAAGVGTIRQKVCSIQIVYVGSSRKRVFPYFMGFLSIS